MLISFDYALKHLLRSKANFDVLEGFLSELLKQGVTVRSITDRASSSPRFHNRETKLDIMAKDARGEIILIRLLCELEYDYLYRMHYGVSGDLTDHVAGDDYLNVRKVYAIYIAYFDMGKGNGYVYHGTTTFRGLHNNNDILLLSPKQQGQLQKEIPSDRYSEYYILKVCNFDEKTNSTLDEWIYFLKTDEIKDYFTAKGLGKAREVLAYDQLTDEECAEYSAIQNERSHKRSMIASAKAEGRAEAEAEAELEQRCNSQ